MERTPEIEEVLRQCYLQTKVCAKVLFPERFFRPFSTLHDQIFNVLDDCSTHIFEGGGTCQEIHLIFVFA